MNNIFGINKWFLILVMGLCISSYSPRTPIKVIGTEILATTKYANATQAYSSTHPVDKKQLVKVTVFFARRATTAATAPVYFHVQGAVNDPPVNGQWDRLATLASGFAVAVTQTTGTEAAAQTVIEISTTTSFTAQNFVYFDNSTAADCEWHEIKSVVASTSITLKEAITNAQTSTAVYTQAQIMTAIVDVTMYNDIRVDIDGLAHTQNYTCKIIVSDVQ